MLKIGIVGAGGMGTVHYSNYKHIDHCEVVALVGFSEQDQIRSQEWNLPLYSSITEMITNQDIDVVDVCTPTFLHKANVLESIGHKKHTIVEKPMTLSKTDAQEMMEMAKKNNCLLFVAQVLQFTKEVGILRELVAKETFGKPLDAYFERLSASPQWAQGGWLFDKSKSGLLPFDLHIHDLDLIVSLFGKPEQVQVFGNKREESSYVEHYRMIYTYPKVNVVAEAAWFHASIPFRAQWRIVFENAVVIYDGSSLIAYPYQEDPIHYNIEDENLIATGINVPPTGWYYNELTHFLTCIEENKKTPYVSDEQLLSVLEVLEEINKNT